MEDNHFSINPLYILLLKDYFVGKYILSLALYLLLVPCKNLDDDGHDIKFIIFL